MKINLEVEAATPIFIAGADQRNIENEGLRAPSLRGLMRWWFRAIMGGMTSIYDVKDLEEKVFGSNERRSKIKIKTSTAGEVEKIEKVVKSWKETIWSDYTDYLFFSCLDKRKDRMTNEIHIKTRPFYKTLQSKIILTGPENEIKIALASLWSLIYLGGVGFRSRRGGGSIKIKSCDTSQTYGLDFVCKARTPNELSTFLKNNINKVREVYTEALRNFGHNYQELKKLPDYNILSPSYSALFIGDSYKIWTRALDAIGQWYLGKRVGKKFVDGFRMNLADYKLSHAIGRGEGTLPFSNERRPFIGLPITYATYKATLTADTADRCASRMLFGVYKIESGYVPRILLFNSKFLPRSSKFNIKKNNTITDIKLDEGDLIKDAYQNLLKSGWTCVWGEIS